MSHRLICSQDFYLDHHTVRKFGRVDVDLDLGCTFSHLTLHGHTFRISPLGGPIEDAMIAGISINQSSITFRIVKVSELIQRKNESKIVIILILSFVRNRSSAHACELAPR